MRICVRILYLDEISIGLHMIYGRDGYGDFHMISFGFLLFSVDIVNYI